MSELLETNIARIQNQRPFLEGELFTVMDAAHWLSGARKERVSEALRKMYERGLVARHWEPVGGNGGKRLVYRKTTAARDLIRSAWDKDLALGVAL